MKKILATSLVAGLAAASVQAEIIMSEVVIGSSKKCQCFRVNQHRNRSHQPRREWICDRSLRSRRW